MARSLKKGPFAEDHLLKKVEAIVSKKNPKKPIQTWSRRSTIFPNFVGLTFQVSYRLRLKPKLKIHQQPIFFQTHRKESSAVVWCWWNPFRGKDSQSQNKAKTCRLGRETYNVY